MVVTIADLLACFGLVTLAVAWLPRFVALFVASLVLWGAGSVALEITTISWSLAMGSGVFVMFCLDLQIWLGARRRRRRP